MKTILVPTDFSKPSFHAAAYAMELANQFNAQLHLLNVFHIPNPLQTLPVEIIITPDEMMSDTDSELKKMANALKEIKPYPVEITLASRNGVTVKEIDEHARYIRADLIVMGLHGADKILERIIGSTTVSVIRNSNIPVLVIPQNVMFNPYQRITFASDGEDIHKQSDLEPFLEIARKFKSEILIMSVLSPHDFSDKDKIIQVLDRSFMNVRHSYYFPETRDVSQGIHEFTKQHHSDLLVMIPRKHGFMSNLFAEKPTTKLAFHSDIPLLSLHD